VEHVELAGEIASVTLPAADGAAELREALVQGAFPAVLRGAVVVLPHDTSTGCQGDGSSI